MLLDPRSPPNSPCRGLRADSPAGGYQCFFHRGNETRIMTLTDRAEHAPSYATSIDLETQVTDVLTCKAVS